MLTGIKQKVIIVITILGLILIYIFQRGLGSTPQAQTTPSSKEKIEVSATDDPQVVSTKPSPLDESIISPTSTIEITFNRPLENIGEFKHKLEPKMDYQVKLSDDRKTAKITASPSFPLGTTYTLFIYANETKFDGGKRLNQDYTFHFKTIEYKGV